MPPHTNYLYHNATGSGAIASTLAPATNFVLVAIKLHLNGAADAEAFTATVDSTEGAAYDVIVYQVAAGTMQNKTDVTHSFDPPMPFKNGDEIDFAYTNSSGRTYGLEVVYREEV